MAIKLRSEMMSNLSNGYDILIFFAKFEKFLPHSIIHQRDLSCCHGNTIFNTCLAKNWPKLESKFSHLWQITKKIRFWAICFLQFSFYLILISYAKFEFYLLRNNEITMTLPITTIFGCCDKVKVRNDVIFKQWLWRHELYCWIWKILTS